MPNALDSEKFPPAEDNVIRGNEIFWNNFNFHEGVPSKPKSSGVVPLVPIGTGLLLLGGRRNLVEDNRVYDNYAMGVAAVEAILLEENPQARALIGNVVRDNAFGLEGTDLNGRDLAYDGNGTANCFGPNSGVAVTIPASSPDRVRRARRFHSEPAASGYRFERKLKQAGRYKIVRTLHEEMNMTIRVRR